MRESVHEEEYRGYTINIYPDSDPLNPREEWENLGTMACYQRGYLWFDSDAEKKDFDGLMLNKETVREILAGQHDDKLIWLPVYVYSHSGETFSTSGDHYPFNDRWDAGLCGVIVVGKEAVRKEYGWKYLTRSRVKQIEGYLSEEVEVLDAYSTGAVYEYVVEDQWGNQLDSAWGYYDVSGGWTRGEEAYGGALRDAKGYVDWKVEAENSAAKACNAPCIGRVKHAR